MSRLAFLLAWLASGLAAPAQAEVLGASGVVHACRVDAQGRVWAGTSAGLVRVAPDGQLRRFTDGLPAPVVLSVDGDLLGTEAGWARVERDRVVEVGPPVAVHAIARLGGRVFFGTWGQGVMTETGPLTFTRPPRSGAHLRVTALVVHEEILHVATAGGGLWTLRGSQLVRHPALAADAWITALGTSGGVLSVATLEGAGPVVGRTHRLGPALVQAYAQLGGALVGAESDAGIPGLPEKGLVTLHAQGDVACAGSADGLWIRRGLGAAWVKVDLGGAPANDIAALAHDGARLWAGYFNAGVAVLEAGAWRRVGEGVIDEKVNVLASQGSVLWVGTARGLYRVEAEEVRRLDERDGLPSTDIHALCPLDAGRLLVGTARGAVLLGDGPAVLLGAKQGLPGKAVWAVARIAGGPLLLGTSSGLYVGTVGRPWTRLSVASGHLPDDWVTALAVRGSEAWVGTYNAGVVRLRWEGGRPEAEALGGGWINFNGLTVAGDTLYAGTMDGLVERALDGGAWRPVTGVTPQDTTQVLARGGSLWAGTRRGLTRLAR